jgi:diguanylate cyclase (GGDEF)-like protein/PAS domain S-box-containing protein
MAERKSNEPTGAAAVDGGVGSAEHIRYLITGARCLLWQASIEEADGALHWRLRMSDEEAASRFLPLDVGPGESYSDAWNRSKLPGDSREIDDRSTRALREGRAGYTQEFRCRRADGEIRWLFEDVHIEPLAPGRWRAVGVCTDVTERKRAEAAVRESEQRFRALVQNSSDIIAILDATGVVRYLSPAVEQALGHPPDALTGRSALLPVHRSDLARVRAALAEVLCRPEAAVSLEFRVRHRRGSWRTLRAVAQNLLHEPGVAGVVVNARDITEQKVFEEELARHAFRDPVTSLANRALFTDRLKHALSSLSRRGDRVAVLFLDLDRFKWVNDALGHASGDALLHQVGQRLNECVREADTVARFGGDEFTILLDGVDAPEQAGEVAERIIRSLEAPFYLAGRETFVGVSIGIALCGTHLARPDDLLRDADLALYRAKSSGKGCYVLFDEPMEAMLADRLELETGLRHAVERGQLRLHYQPEVDLATGRVLAVEAMVRWQHPDRGLLSPAAFLPVAEETGMITAIGQWVRPEACRRAAAWAAAFPEAPPLVSVNLSGREFRRRHIARELEDVLRAAGLPASSLRVEITETMLVEDGEAAIRTLQSLRELGVGVAIDDFGTGYSSLGYLRRLPVDLLKIDRTFVRDLESGDGAARSIVHAVCALGRALNVEVSAEGIETERQLAEVKAAGCSRGQGFLFSRPVDAAALSRFLRTANRPSRPSLIERPPARERGKVPLALKP